MYQLFTLFIPHRVRCLSLLFSKRESKSVVNSKKIKKGTSVLPKEVSVDGKRLTRRVNVNLCRLRFTETVIDFEGQWTLLSVPVGLSLYFKEVSRTTTLCLSVRLKEEEKDITRERTESQNLIESLVVNDECI